MHQCSLVVVLLSRINMLWIDEKLRAVFIGALFLSQNNVRNLDPSYKTDLDFWHYFGLL